jgi:hypothetical protein
MIVVLAQSARSSVEDNTYLGMLLSRSAYSPLACGHSPEKIS